MYSSTYTTACRVWWTLTVCGARDVRVLCGGLARWLALGFAIESGPSNSPLLRK